MQYKFLDLVFKRIEFPPSSGGLYLAVNPEVPFDTCAPEPKYVGEAKNLRIRVRRKDHEGLNRAAYLGANALLYSQAICDEIVRRDYETLLRREYRPPANLQPIPSLESCIDAAMRLGLSEYERKYRDQLLIDLLFCPPVYSRFKDLPKRTNALSNFPLKSNSLREQAPMVNALAGSTFEPRQQTVNALSGSPLKTNSIGKMPRINALAGSTHQNNQESTNALSLSLFGTHTTCQKF